MKLHKLKRYPKTQFWLLAMLPRVKQKPRVWQSFVKWSGLQPAGATKALLPYTSPLVELEPLQVGPPFKNLGVFREAFPERINLAYTLLANVEKEFDRPEMRLLMESAVLHELCHWGWRNETEPSREPGEDFEKEAYGFRPLTRYWQKRHWGGR